MSFVGIGKNYLNSTTMNRTLVIFSSDFDNNIDEIIESSKTIVEGVSNKIKNDIIFEILSATYFRYKELLKIIKELMEKKRKFRIDFHGIVDFYHLIKGIANELWKLGEIKDYEKVPIIIEYIERNFGVIDYDIDIDFVLKFDEFSDKITVIKNILEDFKHHNENINIKINSIFLFKKLYNLECDKRAVNIDLKINDSRINDYNLIRCINNNRKDINSRFLLIEINSSLIPLVYQYIKLQNPLIEINLYEKSTFFDDNNNLYTYNKIIQIIDDIKNDKLIIIDNFNQIHPFLYGLYKQNYLKINDRKYGKISLYNFNEFSLNNDKIRFILFVDKYFVEYCDLAFLIKFEKVKLSLDTLLDNRTKRIANEFLEEINWKNFIEIDNSLKDLLINCGKEEIQGLIFYFSKLFELNENKDDEKNNINEKKLKEKVLNKIYKILPQNIISALPENNIIKKEYYKLKNVNNLKDYINKKWK